MLVFRVFWNVNRGYGATAARLTPDQKVGSSNLSALISLLGAMWLHEESMELELMPTSDEPWPEEL